MATAAELELWKAFGGSVEERTSGKRAIKTYIAPNGKKFRSLKEAAAFMKAEEAQGSQGRKRVQASPDINEDAADNAKKRAKTGKSNKSTERSRSTQGKGNPGDTVPKATKQQSEQQSEQQDEQQAAEPMEEDVQEQPNSAEDSNCEAAEETAETGAASRSGRLAAQGKKYKERQVGRVKASDKLQIKAEPDVDSEVDAFQQTKTEKSGNMRRLLHFTITDEHGEMQSLDRVELLKKPLKLSGAVYPETGPLNKENGRMVADAFGPISSWYISYNSNEPVMVACTAAASYQLSKPASAYKKVHAALEEQTMLTWHVLQALDKDSGGDPTASLDAVVAKLARAKAGRGYSSAREALLLNGRFVLSQVTAHDKRNGGAAADDKGKGKAPAGISSGPFCTELQAELAKGPIQVGVVSGNAITIKDKPATAAAAENDAEAPDALTVADEEMARRLQAKMDAQQYKASGNKGRGHGSAAPYIKISEAEIADDYPMPQQYKAPDGVEETDELLLWDEELADCDPEYLPKRLITDFSIYNAEGFFASLELLPLWSGVDPDVELFASGVVKDDEGDWGTGGQPLELRHDKHQQQKGDKKQLKPSAADGSTAAAAVAGGSSSAVGGSSAAAAATGGSSSAAGGSSAAAAAGGSSSGAGGSSSAAGASAAGEDPAAAEPPAEAAAEDVAEDDGPDPVAEGGMRLYLSQIREWVVEYSADMLFISIRTDAAWYKLCRPNKKYKPWYGVPLKAARVAVKVIHALSEQSRVSRLSFNDVVKMLADAPQDSSTFISRRADRVERYLVVHGQILLNQIKAYPNQAVQRSQFVTGLKTKMEMRKHSKLYYTKKGTGKLTKGVQRNPMKDRAPSARSKPMPATATTMVRSIWQNYFYSMDERDDAVNKQKAEEAAAQGVAEEVEDDPLEEDEQDGVDAQENALAGSGSPSKKRPGSSSSKGKKAAPAQRAGGDSGAGSSKAAADDKGGKQHAAHKVAWDGKAQTAAGKQLYAKAQVGSWVLEPGTVVLLEAEQQEDTEQQQHLFAMVQCMWQDEDGDKMAQVRILVPGAETVLGDAGSEAELFVTDDFEDVLLSEVQGLVTASRLTREFDPDLRVRHFEEDEALRKRNAAAKAAGKPLEYFFRHLYLPEQGMFKALPENLDLGVYKEEQAAPVELAMTDNKEGFIKQGVTYNVGDFLFVLPGTFDADAPESADEAEQSSEPEEEEEEDEDKENKPDTPSYMKKKSRFHKGSIDGLKAWGIARLLEVKEAGSSSRGSSKDKQDAKPSTIKVQRFYRPEDISKDQAYKANFWDVYATPKETSNNCHWVQWIDMGDVVKKCAAKAEGTKTPEGAELLDIFDVVGTYNPTTKKVTAAPEEFKTKNDEAEQEEEEDYVAMASMDIFAGCGGLSEGMHQAKVAETKWAIEYERPAADAFQLNNPDAAVFCDNCNVILLAAMQKAGQDKDASACEDARAAASKMSAEDVARLPLPGDVEFIMGGPPCQGYSGMNRFNKGNWSMVQNSMVMSYLSFADFYRPRYFLLENVRNFVSHNKSFTFRLTVRTLLDMGYQVRFGVLNAGNFGVSQSRKRTFIWAAAPQERLPDWPRPKHVFRSPQLTVNLPGGVAYCAVDTSVPGGPLRTVTVRDAIGDLPAIENGHSMDVMDYTGPPVSAFQRSMRSQAKQLRDHICKEMNPLNLERCRCIPKDTPGADWRVLVDIVKNDPSREKYQGQPLVPWCLPNTAARHNGWRGLFGRLDLDGHFPTSTTDPQPMGKVGQVFHPNQDRIVSVRECARSQGFPDHFLFSGNVHARHRQVGNAVPPPLAASLGRQLYKVLQQTHQERKVLF